MPQNIVPVSLRIASCVVNFASNDKHNDFSSMVDEQQDLFRLPPTEFALVYLPYIFQECDDKKDITLIKNFKSYAKYNFMKLITLGKGWMR